MCPGVLGTVPLTVSHRLGITRYMHTTEHRVTEIIINIMTMDDDAQAVGEEGNR